MTIKEQEKLDDEAQNIIYNFALSLSKEKENLKEKDYRVLESSIRSALEIYSHSISSMQNNAANNLNNLYTE